MDERYKSRDETIKTYFDSQITKILIGSGEVDKCMMLGREISALQILNDKQRKCMEALIQEKDSVDVNLRFFKAQLGEVEARHKD